MNEFNGLPPKQINRTVTPIKLDSEGNKLEEEKPIITENKPLEKKEHDPSTMIFVTILFIILAIVCFIIFYFIVPSYMNEEEGLKYNDGTTTTTKIINNTISTIRINNGQVVNVANTFILNRNYQITTVKSNNILDIYVNNVKVTSSKNLLPIIGFVDDLVIFSVQDDTNRTTKLYSVDKTGNIVLELYDIPNVEGMVLLPDSSSVIYNSISIVLMASRINGNNLILDSNYGITTGLNICNQEDLNIQKIDDNFLVMGTYSIEYLGDHRFSEPFAITNISLGEYKTTNNLCQ